MRCGVEVAARGGGYNGRGGHRVKNEPSLGVSEDALQSGKGEFGEAR